MKSPMHAILWEIWRITRVEVAWKLALSIGGALIVLTLFAAFAPSNHEDGYEHFMDSAAAIALILIVIPPLVGWLSLAKLGGARLGFPLYPHYTRPVRTAVMVGLPMMYLTVLSAAIYLVSALVLRLTSQYAFPLLPVAAWTAAFTLVSMAVTWSIRNRVIQLLIVLFAFNKILGLIVRRLTAVEIPGGYDWPPRLWPTLFDFPLTDYTVIAVIGVVSFGVTVAMVARQRRGDELGTITATPVSGLRGWLINLFRVACPTSSATRAQLWFDLKSNGLPMLTIGVTLALVILLLSAVGGPIDAAFADEIRASLSCKNTDCFFARTQPVFLMPLSLLIVLFLARNAFGIRSKQGRTDMSVFEATQPYGAAQLATQKVLVKSGCALAALIALGMSAWASVSLLGDPVFIQIWNVPLSSRLPSIKSTIAALAGYELLALVALAAVSVVSWVAALAVLGALRVRYSRRVNITVSLLVLSLFALALLKLAEHEGILSPFLFATMFTTARWILFAAMVFVIACVFRIGVISFAERVLTIRYASGTVAISAVFAAAWLIVLQMAGVQLAGMSAMNVFWILLPALLPLFVSVLAPWSLNRIRHT